MTVLDNIRFDLNTPRRVQAGSIWKTLLLKAMCGMIVNGPAAIAWGTLRESAEMVRCIIVPTVYTKNRTIPHLA